MKKGKDDKKEKFKEIFSKFQTKIEKDYSAQNITVYMISSDDVSCIIGDKVEDMIIERYMSYSNTMLLRSPVGLQEDRAYKSRIVTQVKIGDDIFLIVISSYKLEAFKQDIKKIIEDVLEVRKEGELI